MKYLSYPTIIIYALISSFFVGFVILFLVINYNTGMRLFNSTISELPGDKTGLVVSQQTPPVNLPGIISVPPDPVPTQTPAVMPSPRPVAEPRIIPTAPKKNTLLWGAYVGDAPNNLSKFESLVGKKTHFYADFENWDTEFPMYLLGQVGQTGKTLIIFWEPSFGYDSIIDGSYDSYVEKFAADAKKYGYPIILVPFVEMNLNEEAWGYDVNNNTAEKFKIAWKHVHDLFAGVSNVKFGLGYNNVSVPNIKGNNINDYYPGSAYVDYIGVDGFNFTDPGESFAQIFDAPMSQVAVYNKPIIIFSMGTVAGPNKAKWITDGLGSHIKNYKNVIGWVWFNQSGLPNWLVNSDANSLEAFKNILPQT